jgi:hypothetical protein
VGSLLRRAVAWQRATTTGKPAIAAPMRARARSIRFTGVLNATQDRVLENCLNAAPVNRLYGLLFPPIL